MSVTAPPVTDDDPLARPLADVLVQRRGQKATIAALRKSLHVETVGDLLAHLPRRLQDRGEVTDLGALQVGEQVTVVANVETVSSRRMRQRHGTITEVRIGDGRSRLTLTWFGAPWVERTLQPGRRAMFTGKVREYRGMLQLSFPDFAVLDDDVDVEADGTLDLTRPLPGKGAQLARPLIPIYPSTREVPSWAVAAYVDQCLQHLDGLVDPLDAATRRELDVVDLVTALRGAHQPLSRAEFAAARRRLALDEALDIQLVLARRRHAARGVPAQPRPARPDGLRAALDARLPFVLTSGQVEVGRVIETELADRMPMQRLLQGEVGSGKTVVALRAMLQVVDAGGQAALLAPTEVLAVQHARTLRALLGPLAAAGELGGADVATRLALVTGSLGAKARRATLLDVASGAAGIVVGTHALLEERVQFADLGLVVVDEQHRFGVEQRDVLRGRSDRPPHLLVMTATPIPRTVAMTVFGDLETSVLRERPAGRAPVDTVVVPGDNERWLARTWERVREEVAAGRQAFVVCPRIGGDEPDDEVEPPGDADDDAADAADHAATDVDGDGDDAGATTARRPGAAVLDVAPLLAAGELSGLRVELLHGRLPAEDKDAVMAAFAAGEIDVLVATTVIEVGVDVPNASVMVVVDADRFGISQLHQLRGRIGRGRHAGVCLLVSSAPEASPARARLDAVAATDDGFELAEADLEQRREGDVLGAAQSGTRRTLRLLSLQRDRDLIVAARALATQVVDADPGLDDHPGLRRRVVALEAGDRADWLEKT